jgi:hypothetical protein
MPITFSSVDFPDPDGPIMEINSPSSTDKLISFKMKVLADPLEIHFEM